MTGDPPCPRSFPRRRAAPRWAALVLVALVAVPARAGAGPRLVAISEEAPVRVTATAAVLVDARSGDVLFSRNPHLRWPPASTTKIMTALLALQCCPLTMPIRISPEVARFREGSVVGLPEGAVIPLGDLLYGLMLQSGNDVALAIAEGVAGSPEAFVARMNAEAKRLGAVDTHFTSPHGLYAPDHYSTAYDLALITRAALRYTAFREVVRTRRWVFDPPGGSARVLWNHNRLLALYPGADGVKTGYVHQSGQTLVASATRDGWQLIAVLLHSANIWGDAERLLGYGFAHFHPVELARPGEELAAVELPGTARVVAGVVPHGLYAALPVGQVATRRVTLRSHLALPLHRGAPIGQVVFTLSGRVIASAPLVANEDVPLPPRLAGVVQWLGRMLGRLLGATVF